MPHATSRRRFLATGATAAAVAVGARFAVAAAADRAGGRRVNAE